jgi:hypothetical protein
MPSRSNDILAVQGFFWQQLRSEGWKEISNTGSSATFRDGRRVITIANQGDDSLSWCAFASVPDEGPVDPLLGYTGPKALPLGAFEITGSPAACDALANVIDKAGSFAQEPFCTGPMADVHARLFRESVRRIDEFIVSGETIN